MITSYPPCPPSREQTISGAGAVTIDPARGTVANLAAAGDIERIEILPGTRAGEQLTVFCRQSSDARKTWPVMIFGARSAGGIFCKTMTSNAVDAYSYIWSAQLGAWVETSRSLWVA